MVKKHPITKRGSRNAVLVQLTGELFYKFGIELSERIVDRHYQLYKANVGTQRIEHMRQFRAAWQSFLSNEQKRLTDSERAVLAKLHTEPQREAYFLCRSFSRVANGASFPVAQLSLADRLGVTQQGAGYVIAKLMEVGAIKKTSSAEPNKRSACYQWIA